MSCPSWNCFSFFEMYPPFLKMTVFDLSKNMEIESDTVSNQYYTSVLKITCFVSLESVTASLKTQRERLTKSEEAAGPCCDKAGSTFQTQFIKVLAANRHGITPRPMTTVRSLCPPAPPPPLPTVAIYGQGVRH